ncbi:hypothetical protein FHG87_000995 [Trinorchestia longiramus]|nr:hypothetical protein FHG87_000995 [Trinorchestia longiramus]
MINENAEGENPQPASLRARPTARATVGVAPGHLGAHLVVPLKPNTSLLRPQSAYQARLRSLGRPEAGRASKGALAGQSSLLFENRQKFRQKIYEIQSENNHPQKKLNFYLSREKDYLGHDRLYNDTIDPETLGRSQMVDKPAAKNDSAPNNNNNKERRRNSNNTRDMTGLSGKSNTERNNRNNKSSNGGNISTGNISNESNNITEKQIQNIFFGRHWDEGVESSKNSVNFTSTSSRPKLFKLPEKADSDRLKFATKPSKSYKERKKLHTASPQLQFTTTNLKYGHHSARNYELEETLNASGESLYEGREIQDSKAAASGTTNNGRKAENRHNGRKDLMQPSDFHGREHSINSTVHRSGLDVLNSNGGLTVNTSRPARLITNEEIRDVAPKFAHRDDSDAKSGKRPVIVVGLTKLNAKKNGETKKYQLQVVGHKSSRGINYSAERYINVTGRASRSPKSKFNPTAISEILTGSTGNHRTVIGYRFSNHTGTGKSSRRDFNNSSNQNILTSNHDYRYHTKGNSRHDSNVEVITGTEMLQHLKQDLLDNDLMKTGLGSQFGSSKTTKKQYSKNRSFYKVKLRKLRDFLVLPCQRKLQYITSSIDKDQVLRETFDKVQALKQKSVFFLVDEVQIRPTVSISGGLLSGMAENNRDCKATSILITRSKCNTTLIAPAVAALLSSNASGSTSSTSSNSISNITSSTQQH